MAAIKPNWEAKSLGSKQTAEEMNDLVAAIINNAEELSRVLGLPIITSNRIIIDDGISFCDSNGNIIVKIDNSGLSAATTNISSIDVIKVNEKQYNII